MQSVSPHQSSNYARNENTCGIISRVGRRPNRIEPRSELRGHAQMVFLGIHEILQFGAH